MSKQLYILIGARSAKEIYHKDDEKPITYAGEDEEGKPILSKEKVYGFKTKKEAQAIKDKHNLQHLNVIPSPIIKEEDK